VCDDSGVALTPRQQKKRQMVRTGYAGVAVQVSLVLGGTRELPATG